MDSPEESPNGQSFMGRHRQAQVLLLVLVIASIVGVFMVVKPYVHAIILAAVLASVFSPLYAWLLVKVKNRPNVAAGLACLVVALVVIVPITAFMAKLASMGVERFQAVQEWVEADKLKTLPEDERVTAITQSKPMQKLLELRDDNPALENLNMEELQAGAVTAIQNILASLGGQILPLVQNIGSLLFNFLIMLFVMFYFFRESSRIVDFLMRICPLPSHYERRMIERIKVVSKSAVLGTVLTALAQGVLGMLAFAVVGIPWFFWGIVMGFASLVPVVGTALVWVPCVIYLFISGHTAAAIGLFIWCATVVNLADNFLRPYFMKGDTGVPSMLLFFAILGGVQLFGLVGVIYGPLIFGLCAVLLYIYELETELESGDVPDDPTIKSELVSDSEAEPSAAP
jgi:predicted PurR-regulated permease PerM